MQSSLKTIGLVDGTGTVANVAVFDGDVSSFPKPAGFTAVDITNVPNCGIGWGYVNGQFIEPPEATLLAQPISQGAQTF